MKTLLLLRLLSFRVLLVLATACALAPAQAQNTMVRMQTTQGPIDISLLDSEAPLTVANFLAYVRGGDYASVMFHRSVRNFIIQAGAYRWPPESNSYSLVPSRGPVPNEFSPARSNVRGTVAMAKVPGDPNSASSQWFINMNNNAANLDGQNGGFTVFARVTAPGMDVADRIAALPIVNIGSPFTELPVADWPGGSAPVYRYNLVLITGVAELSPPQNSSDRIFNYLEAAYPQYAIPSHSETGEALGYVYRYYSGSNLYIGTKDGKVWYLMPAVSGEPKELGSVPDWLAIAQGAGY
ncbi:MAG: hypothetical protein JWQ07_1568 [Ramlibacter sp.]|nr:hypothetical protein [Ramlibacter sp.]